jgi:hypothetical protein
MTSAPFSHLASIDYPILDADAHVNEPPNLWQDAVPAKWNDRAPKLNGPTASTRPGGSPTWTPTASMRRCSIPR